MVYKFREAAYISGNVSAQEVGETLDRIYQRDGQVSPEAVVEDSRAEDAPLHDCFEWDNDAAAEQYRLYQARKVIASVTVVCDEQNNTQPVRAFVHIEEKKYMPINHVLQTPDMHSILMATLKKDMLVFVRRYKAVEEISKVIDAMENAITDLEG